MDSERRLKMGELAMGVTIALVCLAGGIAFVSSYGPYWRARSFCVFCGMQRYQHTRCGIKLRDYTRESEASKWVKAVYPDHQERRWEGDGDSRWSWFGPRLIGETAIMDLTNRVYSLRASVGEGRARELLQKHHALHARKPLDFEEIHRFDAELREYERAGHGEPNTVINLKEPHGR